MGSEQRRTRFLSFLVYGLLIAGLATLNGTIVALAVPLLVYIGVALYRTPKNPPRLRCHRELSATCVTEGNDVDVTLTLTNEGAHLEEVIVEDMPAAPLTVREGATRALAALPPGETLTLSYTLTGRRGTFDFPEVTVTVFATLGLFQRQVRLPARARLVVLPAFRRLHRVAIRPPRTLGFTGPIASRQSGTGSDFFGVRDYQPGDPLRRINWRATARHDDTPFTTEFEQERIADVGIILDVRRENALEIGSESLLEYSVSAAAALADALLREGHRVGLLLYGHALNWIFPGYGKVQRERMLRALAAARPAGSQVFKSLNFLPTRLFPARSQLIFVSPLAAGDETMLFRLRARGYAVLVVSPDPVTFEASLIPAEPHLPLAVRLARLERRLLLQRLGQAGVVVVDWPVDRALDEVLHSRLRRVPLVHHAIDRRR